MYAPNSNGILGDVTRALSPELAYKIGQYFKQNKTLNQLDNGNRPEEQSPQHLLAHAILGAATNYATGNNPITGALSGAGSEATAPALSKFLFGKDSKELTQDEKDIITNIITLATAFTTYTITDGDVAGSVSAAEVGRVGVENNDHDRLLPNGTSYHPGDRVRFSDEEALFIKDAIGFVVTPVGFLDAYHNAKTDEDKALAVATAFKIPIGKARTYVQKAKTKQNTQVGYEPDNDFLSSQASKKARDEKLIKDAENISTAKPDGRPPQVTAPRNIQEQILWSEVVKNPKTAGKPLNGMNNDPRFSKDAGFQKMEAKMRSNDGKTVVIHYQYNHKTNKAYDIKITSVE
ncbi:filamentous hemagglutinin [Moraxella cuniculi DSM 21768]|uniref:Filamentous hemagglutinin n=1 Tax=Moraxella cuniculi DSM 21768 TaxID=1122245 RepID=A0A1N7ERG5_9GAMM|nr:VENN motif pre-toxin domain-containing protein [Moraxella cuniculi]OOS06293.1 hypothetical protein B0189_05220 [Moraxella cuniculi]SIR90644.1 filamentous hemagglutinin [Moraxella cuniculi DSM 21768]